ncbi:MAG: hypothetical protein ACFFDN_24410 [Candidatus Hodarchaeota archaeon]
MNLYKFLMFFTCLIFSMFYVSINVILCNFDLVGFCCPIGMYIIGAILMRLFE